MSKDVPNIPGMGESKQKPKEEKLEQTTLPQPDVDDEVFEEDFTDISSGGYPMASEGFHHAKVIDFEKSSSKAGNPQYVWQFRILAGDSKDIEIKHWTSLLPQAKWKASETLRAVGLEVEGTVARFRSADVIGKLCILEIFHDEYDGKENHKVEKVHPPTQETEKYAQDESDVPF